MYVTTADNHNNHTWCLSYVWIWETHIYHGWGTLVFKVPCPARFLTISDLTTADYLGQVFSQSEDKTSRAVAPEDQGSTLAVGKGKNYIQFLPKA